MRVVFYFANEFSQNEVVLGAQTSVECQFVHRNDDVRCEQGVYKVLVLPYERVTLEDVTKYRSSDYFDAFAFMSESRNSHDIIELHSVLIEMLESPGVLQRDQISKLMKFHMLIYGASEKGVKPAKFELTLSSESHSPAVGGLSSSEICIQPLSYVLVMAQERCNFPKNVCGIFDLKVNLFCRGIILSNGVQVDPGYRGVLLSLLFNAGATDQTLMPGEVFSAIMFFVMSKTAERGYDGGYMDSKSIGQYLQSAPQGGFSYKAFLDNVSDVADCKKRIVKIEENKFVWVSWTVTMLSVLIAIAVGSPFAGYLFKISELDSRFARIETKLDAVASFSNSGDNVVKNIRNADCAIKKDSLEKSVSTPYNASQNSTATK